MMQTITIWPTSNCWLAHFSDPAMLAEIGTDILPLPFTETAPSEVVQAAVQKSHPGDRVQVDHGRA